MNVPVSGVPKTSHRNPGLFLQTSRKVRQLHQLGSRHHNIFVQLGQARRPERIRKIPAQLPDLLASFFITVSLNRQGSDSTQEILQLFQLTDNRLPPSIDLHNEMRIALRQRIFSQVCPRCLQGELICDLQRRREMPRIQNRLHRFGRFCEIGKGHGQHRAILRMGNDPQGRLGDDTQHPLASHKEVKQIKAGLVLVTTPTHPKNLSVGHHHLNSENIVLGHPILQTSRPTRIGRQVTANRAFSQRRRIRRVIPTQLPHRVL